MGAIADLVVVLQKGDEGARRQVRALLAARRAVLIARRLSLVGEAFRERAAQKLLRVLGEIGVVTVALARQDHVQAVMHVVVPLRIMRGGCAGSAQKMRLVGV